MARWAQSAWAALALCACAAPTTAELAVDLRADGVFELPAGDTRLVVHEGPLSAAGPCAEGELLAEPAIEDPFADRAALATGVRLAELTAVPVGRVAVCLLRGDVRVQAATVEVRRPATGVRLDVFGTITLTDDTREDFLAGHDRGLGDLYVRRVEGADGDGAVAPILRSDLTGDAWPDCYVGRSHAGDAAGAPAESTFVYASTAEGPCAGEVTELAVTGAGAAVSAHLSRGEEVELAVVSETAEGGVHLFDGPLSAGRMTASRTITRVDGVALAFLQSITAADVDEDGRLDLIVTARDDAGTERPTMVLFGDDYQRALRFEAGAGSMQTCVGDLDGDDHVDLLVTTWEHERPSYVYLSDGSPFTSGAALVREPRVELDTGTTFGCALADLDGDGWLDAYLSLLRSVETDEFEEGSTAAFSRIYRGGPNGAAEPPAPIFSVGATRPSLFRSPGGGGPFRAVVPRLLPSDAPAMLGDHSGVFPLLPEPPWYAAGTVIDVPSPGAPADVVALDFDRDGDTDLLFGSTAPHARATVVLGVGPGRFSTTATPVGPAEQAGVIGALHGADFGGRRDRSFDHVFDSRLLCAAPTNPAPTRARLSVCARTPEPGSIDVEVWAAADPAELDRIPDAPPLAALTVPSGARCERLDDALTSEGVALDGERCFVYRATLNAPEAVVAPELHAVQLELDRADP